MGVETVFEGAALGYRLEKTAQTRKTADAAEDVKRRGGPDKQDGQRRRRGGGGRLT